MPTLLNENRSRFLPFDANGRWCTAHKERLCIFGPFDQMERKLFSLLIAKPGQTNQATNQPTSHPASQQTSATSGSQQLTVNKSGVVGKWGFVAKEELDAGGFTTGPSCNSGNSSRSGYGSDSHVLLSNPTYVFALKPSVPPFQLGSPPWDGCHNNGTKKNPHCRSINHGWTSL